MRKRAAVLSIAAVLAGVVVLPVGAGAQAGDLHVICSTGLKGAMETIVPEYGRVSGRHVTIEYGASAVLKRTIEDGKAFDLAILTPAVVEDLIKEGRIAAGTRRDLARSDLAVGIRAGAPLSDIGTADALKRRLLAARSITYAREGAATATFVNILNRLGIAEAVAPKTILQTISGRPSESVADGESELVFAPLSEIVPVRGVQVLGRFPSEFQSPLIMTAGIGAQSRKADAVGALLEFLASANATPAFTASGMDRITTKE
jgi:molybdate transport system substrate-binding protein